MKSLHLTKPHLLVVVGMPGSGKTFFAEQFAETFSAPFLHHAQLRQKLHDDALASEVADDFLAQLFRTKQTILIEGKGNARTERQTLATLARTHGYEPLFIWVQTEPLTAKARALKVMTQDQFDATAKKFTPLHANEKYMVISGRHTYASQAKIVLKKLVEPRSVSSVQQPASRPADKVSSGGRITIK